MNMEKFNATFLGSSENITPETRKEIEFSEPMNFRETDGSFSILKSSDRTFTRQDISGGGFTSRQEKIDFSFSKLFKGLPQQLASPMSEMPPERKVIVDSLIAGKPTFLPLRESEIDDYFVRASEQFSGIRAGAILLPETGSIMNQFSAIEYPDGQIARLMRKSKRDNLTDFISRVNFLTPEMQAREIDEKEDVYAMEFVRDGERPKKITQDEMEDWLSRVKESGLIFEFDVGENDNSLDNFIRREGRLFWVDGNILGAKPAESEEDLDLFQEKQGKILVAYIKD